MRFEQDTPKTCLSRRDLLKFSLAAGATLATGGIARISAAATKETTPADKPEYAKNQFLKSMNCSQAILETYGPSLGLPVEQARKVAAAFAGGMGMGSECGAVTGAFMVIGMKYGKTADTDSRADNETFKRLASPAWLKHRSSRNFSNLSAHSGLAGLVVAIKTLTT